MPDTPSFNLLDEPWIPCLMEDNELKELSVRSVLSEATEIREIVDASPVITAALHRLLLAILHRCCGPTSDKDWWRLWQAGALDISTIGSYLHDWKHRFDLFERDWPFYQTAGITALKVSSAAKLTHELSAGNNALLFDHCLDSHPPALLAAAAARYLVALQAFAVGGLVGAQQGETGQRSADAAPLARAAVMLLQGNNLFETLLLNMVNLNGAESAPFEFDPRKDAPAWEHTQPVEPRDRLPDGYLDLLTWQSRRVLLMPETLNGTIVVRRILLMKGFQFPNASDLHGRETMVAFQRRTRAIAGQDPWPPIGFRPERALWRDSLALLQQVPEQRHRPRTFDEVAARELDPAYPLRFAALGISSDRAKVLLWREERLPLPKSYLADSDLVAELGRGIHLAEDAARVLHLAVWYLALRALFPEGNPDQNRVRDLADSLSAERTYWAALDASFRRLMIELAEAWPGEEKSAPMGDWARLVQKSAAEAFETAAHSMEVSGRGLRAAAEARGRLDVQMHRTLEAFLPATQSW